MLLIYIPDFKSFRDLWHGVRLQIHDERFTPFSASHYHNAWQRAYFIGGVRVGNASTHNLVLDVQVSIWAELSNKGEVDGYLVVWLLHHPFEEWRVGEPDPPEGVIAGHDSDMERVSGARQWQPVSRVRQLDGEWFVIFGKIVFEDCEEQSLLFLVLFERQSSAPGKICW